MKKGKSLVQVVLICLVLLLVALPLIASCAKPAQTTTAPSPTASTPASSPSPSPSPTKPREEIALTAVTIWPKGVPQTEAFYRWADRVNELGKGKVRIEIRGGAEVIPALDQFQAMKSGIVDVTLAAAGAHPGEVPEGGFLNLTPWPTPVFPDIVKREQESGLTDLMKEIYQKKGVRYLGRMILFSPNYLFTTKPVNSPGELKGRKIRSVSRYNPVLEAYGAVPVSMMDAEVYTSLERGVVEGYVGPLTSVLAQNWNAFLKYCTPEPFFEQDVFAAINLDKWNSLPDDVKKLLEDTLAYAQDEYVIKYYKAAVDKSVADLTAQGMQFIKFSPADSKAFQDAIQSGMWKTLNEKANLDYLARFKAIVAKATK